MESGMGISGARKRKSGWNDAGCDTGWAGAATAGAVLVLASVAAAQAQSSVQLGTINVESTAPQSALGPVEGYVASDGTTATKTDTPLIETPQSISVVTRDQMTAQAAQTVGQALRYTPGVNGEVWGNDARGYGIQIRGFNDQTDTIFYRDGLSMRGSAFTTFANLDPYGSERIEVLRGPSSVLYGQGEPSGIINYVSKRPLDRPLREIELDAGSYEMFQGKFDLSGPIDKDKTLLYRLTGLIRDNDTQVDYVGQHRVFIAPALTWKPNLDTTLTILGNYQRDRSGWDMQFYPALGTVFPNPNGHIPSNRFLGKPGFDNYGPTQYSIGYQFEHRLSEIWTVRQNLRFAHFDNNNQIGVFGNGGPGFGLQPDMRTYVRYGDFAQSNLDGFAVDNQAQAKFNTGLVNHTLLLGVDYQHSRFRDFGQSYDAAPIDIFDPDYSLPVTPGDPYQDTHQKQSQTGIYVQDQMKFDRWVLNLGGRYDWSKIASNDVLFGTSAEQHDSASTGRAGLLYKFDNGVAPYVSYATSFLPLLGTDASLQPFKPETGRQYEVGVKYQPPGTRALFTVGAFDLKRQNVLTMDPLDPNFSKQSGEIQSRGIEVEAAASLASGWDVKAAYTYLDTKFTENDDGTVGNTPWNVPKHRVALWADYTFRSGPLAGFGLGGGLRYQSRTFGDDANTFTVPGFAVADAAIHYDWKNYRFAINARNLFDKEYVAGCYDFSFGCFYGERRRVVASLRYRW
jgi:iron complex outermembrane receptor protein